MPDANQSVTIRLSWDESKQLCEYLAALDDPMAESIRLKIIQAYKTRAKRLQLGTYPTP